MISQIGASASAETRAPQAQVRQTSAAESPAATSPNGKGEASVGRAAETAEAVDAPRQSDRVLAAAFQAKRSEPERSEQAEPPPDEDAPTGPPPTFDHTLLEREARQRLDRARSEPADVAAVEARDQAQEIAQEKADAARLNDKRIEAARSDEVRDQAAVNAAPTTDLPEPVEAPSAPATLEVPPTPSEQVETTVTAVRQIEQGAEPSTVDVTR